MKKFNFVKIVSMALVCAMLLGAFMFTTIAADEPVVEIVSNNVYYGDMYQLMFAVNAPEGATVSAADSEGNAIGVATFAEDPTPTINGVECKAYILTAGVAAQAIDEVITFTVTYGNVTVSKSYSVLQYVYERMYVKNIAKDAELAMFEALIAYANAANAHLNGATTDFNDYKYVTVVGGTLDGNNATGMFLPGATPFENIVSSLVLEEGYGVEWTVSVNGGEAVVKSFDEIKTFEITENTVVTATAVESTCEHVWVGATCTDVPTCELCGVAGEPNGHAWENNATCTTAETCANCDATGKPALGHTTPNVSGNCERCGVSLLKKATMSYTGGTTNMTGNNDAATVGLDASLFSVIGNKGGTNNNCGLNKDGQIRLYGNKADGNGSYFTVKVAEGYTIQSITITFTGAANSKNCKVTTYNAASGAYDTVLGATSSTNSSTTLSVDVNADSFRLQNVITGATTQIYIKSIVINYIYTGTNN